VLLRAPGRAYYLQGGKIMRYGGLGGLIVLVADVWAIVNIFQSGASTGDKVLWTVLVIVLPILGFIIWFFFGPRGRA
jgi:succinate dehydrogenase/fumarate reductase cytochrome b subunit